MPKDQMERVKSSLIFRLTGKFSIRLLGIFISLDLLLILLAGGLTFLWASHLGEDISALVETHGVPGHRAALWMKAGQFQVKPLDHPPEGAFSFSSGRASSPDKETWWSFDPPILRLERITSQGRPYAILLDLTRLLRNLQMAAVCLLIWEAFILILHLFRNTRTLSHTLRPIQELAAAASRLGNLSSLSHQELRELADKLDEINSSHLDLRITTPSARQEMIALTDAINSMLERIDRAYQSQARFVSDASHELRTPIAVVRGYADMLDRWGKKDPNILREAIDSIRAEAVTMQNLVEQLLFLARGDNNSTSLQPQPFDLTIVAGQLIKEAQMIDSTHTFEGRWRDSMPISADLALIKQAGRILIDNAIKYSPEGGRILVEVRLQEGRAAFSVEDEGQGISSEDLPHIFDRFYRTDESRARQTGGSGLGLSIAKWIVERHGGFFQVVSRVGIGSRFTMLLPVESQSCQR